MKITIDIDQQDIISASSEAFSGLFAALKEISKSKAEGETETNEGNESPEKNVPAKQKKESVTKASEGKKNPVKSPSLKVSEAKATETKKDVEEAKTTEPENTEEVAEAETKADEEEKAAPAKKESKPDRAAISERLKEIAKNGKAEGKPKKIKALLQEYGVEKVPDLPDDKLEEFLEKVEAL